MEGRRFAQVDVFTAEPYRGNPVAVVLDADGLSVDEMQRIARWTNLSETTFVVAPTRPGADYRVRIFTPDVELPFAGHPTIGTCHAWLDGGGEPASTERIVQECGIGPVELRRRRGRLGFTAPPLRRAGPVQEADLEPVLRVLGVGRDEIVDARWADNGPGWIAVLLPDADAVSSVTPDPTAVEAEGIGIVGPHPVGVVGPVAGHRTGEPAPVGDDPGPAIEVRAFFRAGGQVAEDPVTGSLNAALAPWLIEAGVVTAPYVASQGTVIGRRGRVHVDVIDGDVWVGGDAVTCVAGILTHP